MKAGPRTGQRVTIEIFLHIKKADTQDSAVVGEVLLPIESGRAKAVVVEDGFWRTDKPDFDAEGRRRDVGVGVPVFDLELKAAGVRRAAVQQVPAPKEARDPRGRGVVAEAVGRGETRWEVIAAEAEPCALGDTGLPSFPGFEDIEIE